MNVLLYFCGSRLKGGAGGEEHERAGATRARPSPPKPVTRPPRSAALSRHAAAAPEPEPEAAVDASSDLDVSESLPRDGPASPEAAAASPPAVYAVVRKKRQPGRTMAESCVPRSPVSIPLIKISQTESVERAERAPPQRQPAVADDAPRRLPRQVLGVGQFGLGTGARRFSDVRRRR